MDASLETAAALITMSIATPYMADAQPSHNTRKPMKYLSLLTLKHVRLLTLTMLAASVLIGTAAYSKKKQDGMVHSPKAHHVIYGVWRIEKDGAKTLLGIRVRDVLESGRWSEWSAGIKSGQIHTRDYTAPDDKTQIAAGPAYYQSVAHFRAAPNLIREETIAGIQVFTIDVSGRKPGEDKDAVEESFSPEYGATPLKFANKTTVIEALKVY
jgi:hypothetical protein